MFLKVSPSRGMRRFGVSGKLSARFIGPFEVLERVGPEAYRVALPPRLAGTHDVFHISALRKYVFDPVHAIDFTSLELCNWVIPYVKILWRNHEEREATWVPEAEMMVSHPFMFETPS